MKITLCYPPLLPGQKPKYGLPPMGILYIASELQQHGYEVEVIDGDIEGYTSRELADLILKGEPDLVGFSIMTPQITAALQTSWLIKELRPDLPIAIGGAHVMSTGDDLYAQADCFDFLVDGEGEATMLEICRVLDGGGQLPECLDLIQGVIFRNTDGEIVTNPKRAFQKELDDFAPLDYGLLDPFKYKVPTLPGPPVVGMMITRGCPFPCTYCDAPTTTGKKIRFHSAERAVADIVRLNKQFGVRGFSFRDSTFTAKKKWVVEFCEKLIESGVDIAWRCNTRVDCLTEDLLKLMKRSGCHTINFGVESGHPEILKRIKKDVDLDLIYKAHEWTNKIGIRTYTTFLVGSPGETDETIRASIDLAKKARPSMAMFFVTIAYPGTEMYKEAVEQGLVEDKWWHKDTWDEDKNTAFEKRWGWSADAGSLVVPGFESEKWQKRATREFYMRPRFIWDTIKFTLTNPYFFKHAAVLSLEVLPFVNRLKNPFKRSRVNEEQRIYSRCPSAPNWDYEKRPEADAV